MSDSFWRPTVEQRRTILLLEALGLIHDLGKLSDAFLKSQEPSSTQAYNHNLLADPNQIAIFKSFTVIPSNQATNQVQEWLSVAATQPCAFSERSDLTGILDKVRFTDWTGQEYSFAELSPFLARPGLANPALHWKEVLGKEIQPGLLIGCLHGSAHIEKEGEPDAHKQPYGDVFSASPFGLEERIATVGVQRSTDAFRAIPLADIEQIASGQRQDWLDKMKGKMSCGLADNRRPHNEVSLWDWGYSVAALTKAAAVWIFRNKWPGTLGDLPFRTLRINRNRLECYSCSDKISDLLGLRQALDNAFDKVKKLLEEEYALGNCFYHDETGAYYLFPDLDYSDQEITALRNEIQRQFPFDLCPQVYFGERITAGQLDAMSASHSPQAVRHLVAQPRHDALNELSVISDNNLYHFDKEWTVDRPENAEICTVCGVRPVGYAPATEQNLGPWASQKKAEQRKVCRVCLDRRGRRSKDWVENGLSTTIWTNEVADETGRLALFVGKLGLEGWLDGALLKAIAVTSSITKNPSPARLLRIAESARAFWKQITGDVSLDAVDRRPCRLALCPSENKLPDLWDYHAYELVVDGLSLSVVWDIEHKCFLTAENLAYFMRRRDMNRDDLAEPSLRKNTFEGIFKGRVFDVMEPSEFSLPGQVLGTVHIKEVKVLDGYQPVIPLLAEPGLCMTLVPADKAMDLARAARDAYERHMGRVRDRLPLGIGLVFFKRRTPVRAALEAGRAMLDMIREDKWEGWGLIFKDHTSDPTVCKLVFDNGITWQVPVVAGDLKTPDKWYPSLYIVENMDKKQVKHVKDLKVRDPNMPKDKGWKVWVRPSYFDFEFLDSTGRRFEIHYGPDGRRSTRRTRPFYLEDLDRMDKFWEYFKCLSKSQRHQVIHTIEATREAWHGQDENCESAADEVFCKFVEDTLAVAAWPQNMHWRKIDPACRKELIQAGVRGELTDLAELHMEILKE